MVTAAPQGIPPVLPSDLLLKLLLSEGFGTDEECQAAAPQFQALLKAMQEVVRQTGQTMQGAAQPRAPPCFTPLELETRPTVDTAAAAYYLNRRPQSLRQWACYDDGPIRPLHIHGRLAWSVSELKRVLGVK